jgi:hypothetical protein
MWADCGHGVGTDSSQTQLLRFCDQGRRGQQTDHIHHRCWFLALRWLERRTRPGWCRGDGLLHQKMRARESLCTDGCSCGGMTRRSDFYRCRGVSGHLSLTARTEASGAIVIETLCHVVG